MEATQSKLDSLYNEYLDRIFADEQLLKMVENYELSSPHFLDVNVERGNYLGSEFKIVFVGKETNGWFNPKERQDAGLEIINKQNQKYLSALKQNYLRHNIGVNYRTAIYTFMDLVIEKMSERLNTGFILTELLRQDYLCAALPYDLIPKIAYDNNYILRKEIEILEPDAIVFLTGPNYDSNIKLTYPEAAFQSFSDYPKSQIAIIEGIPKVGKAIRIYHPDAHKYQGEDFRYEMVEIIKEHIRKD